MSTDVRFSDGITVRLDTDDYQEALEEAAELGFEGDGSIVPGGPVGADGGDAEDAIAEGEAQDRAGGA